MPYHTIIEVHVSHEDLHDTNAEAERLGRIVTQALTRDGYKGVAWVEAGGMVPCVHPQRCNCAECCSEATRLGITGRLSIGRE